MKLADFSVSRPIFISMFACITLVLGGISLKYLPVDLFPEIDFPACSITTFYDDASPQEVEELITRPIERQISAVTGIEEITSISSEETSSVIVRFTWGTNLDNAISDIRDRIDRALKMLPDDVDRPMLIRFNSASMPIMRLGVSTDMDLTKAKKYLEDSVVYRFERVEGVASANVSGGYDREIHVLLDVDKAKLLRIPLTDILNKLRSANVTTPAGNQKSGTLDVRLRTIGTFSNLDEIRDLFLTVGPDGSAICVRDVAEVVDTHEEATRFVRINGKPGIYIEIYKQSGSNTVGVAKEVRAELEKINTELAGSFNIVPVTDESEYIQRSINNVSNTAVSGGLLAILILFVFLCNIRSTLIIAISIPLSIVATFALIYFCGFTLNIMTLGGLALGVGMLVDNSIVVLENTVRLHDGGMPRAEAARQGASEVTSALISSTLTTVAVFLPMVFMKGMAGVMFKQLAYVIAFALLCSLVSALTIVPMLCGQMLTESESQKTGFIAWFARVSKKGFDALADYYADALDSVLRHKLITIIFSVGLLSFCFVIAPLIGTELMPKTDEGQLRINMEDAVGTGPEFVNETVIATEQIIRSEVPGLKHWTSSAGASTWNSSGGHKASYNLKLVPRTERSEGIESIAAKLGKELNKLPGTIFRVRAAQSFMGGRGAGGDAIQIDIRGYDFETAEDLARRVQALCLTVEGVTDAKLSRDIGMPENRVIIDREKAGKMKVDVNTIANCLRLGLAGTQANYFRENGYEYKILVKVKDAKYMSTDSLLDLTVRNGDGENVALRNFLTTEKVLGPVTIERKNQQRNLTVSANLYDRDLGSAVEEMQEKIKSLYPLPADFTISFSGDYEDQQETFHELGMAFALALVLVYMVMACQFESLIDPLIVMFSVPLAAIGVILMLFLTYTTFNIQSFIGCVMLAGIVVNNAILLVDTANLLRRRDKLPLAVAVRETGRRRLRPILMTTLTTVLGLIPLALGLGEGGESQAPLARAVIGGLTSSTLITLFFIPAFYAGWEGWRERAREKKALKKQKKAEAAGTAPAPGAQPA